MARTAPLLRRRLLVLAALCAAALASPAAAQGDLAARFKAAGLNPVERHAWFRPAADAPATVAAVLPGTDAKLRGQYVVISAPQTEAGTAALLTVAEQLRGTRARRSILFVATAGDASATPQPGVVTELNLAPATARGPVAAAGLNDTSLGVLAADFAGQEHMALTAASLDEADPRRASGEEAPLISFALLWSDDAQPALPETTQAAYRMVERLARTVADQPARPLWLPGSRFATPSPSAHVELTAPVELPLSRRRSVDPNGLG